MQSLIPNSKNLLTDKSEDVFNKAYKTWKDRLFNSEFDDQISYFLNTKIIACSGGRLRDAREALQLSSGEVAKRLGILRTSYLKIEKNDSNGSIQLNKLAIVAEVLECELVYALRPKCGLRFSEMIWKRVLPAAMENPFIRTRDPKTKERALVAAVFRKLSNAKFVREQGWTQRPKGFNKDRSY